VPQEKQQVAVAKPAADQHIVVHRQERETTQEKQKWQAISLPLQLFQEYFELSNSSVYFIKLKQIISPGCLQPLLPGLSDHRNSTLTGSLRTVWVLLLILPSTFEKVLGSMFLRQCIERLIDLLRPEPVSSAAASTIEDPNADGKFVLIT